MFNVTRSSKRDTEREGGETGVSMTGRSSRSARPAKAPARSAKASARAAQNLVWYEALLESGVMVLGGGKYSLTLRLSDINYQMATEDRQRALLEHYARFFNGFGASEQLQITIVNRRVEKSTMLAKVLFPEPRHGDRLTEYRADHNKIVSDKIGGQRYSIVAEKYLTITVSATSLDHAVPPR